jgi:hypothetical protein
MIKDGFTNFEFPSAGSSHSAWTTQRDIDVPQYATKNLRLHTVERSHRCSGGLALSDRVKNVPKQLGRFRIELEDNQW